ncbi:MAG TPA: hypothetical protein EYP85_13785 [Armatimonadetes bacterium]|nr:hypothetical protein [Armatimonadota bacterium]
MKETPGPDILGWLLNEAQLRALEEGWEIAEVRLWSGDEMSPGPSPTPAQSREGTGPVPSATGPLRVIRQRVKGRRLYWVVAAEMNRHDAQSKA